MYRYLFFLLLFLGSCSVKQSDPINLSSVSSIEDKFLIKISRKSVFFPNSSTAEARFSVNGRQIKGLSSIFSSLGTANIEKIENENTGLFAGTIDGNRATALITTVDGKTGRVEMDSGDGSQPVIREITFRFSF